MAITVYVETSEDTLVGAINGVNKAFEISNTPDAGSVIVFVNRVFMASTVSGTTITLAEAPLVIGGDSDKVFVRYIATSTAVAVSLSFSTFATDVLELIGVATPGDNPSSDEIERVRRIFNRMVGQWNIDGNTVYRLVPESFTFVANQGSYQIGPGGADYPNSQRPTKIILANIIYDNITLPLNIWTAKEYQEITIKTITSDFPLGVYNNNRVGYTEVFFWPVPTATHTFQFWTWKQFSSIDDASDTLSLPPGYEEAFLNNCAELACLHFQRPITKDIRDMARRSKNRILSFNVPEDTALMDPIQGMFGYDNEYNYLTGGE